MKKSLFALAAVTAFAGAAQAQSSVTVYGLLDVGYTGGNMRSSTPAHGVQQLTSNRISNNMESGSRLGFRGTEDLGKGLSAIFTFEVALSPTGTDASSQGVNTAFTSMRQAFVGLSQKGMGNVRVGTQNSLYWEQAGSNTTGQLAQTLGSMLAPTSAGAFNGTFSTPATNAAAGVLNNQGFATDAYTARTTNTIRVATDRMAGLIVKGAYTLNNQNQNQSAIPVVNPANAGYVGGNNNQNGYQFALDYVFKKANVQASYASFTAENSYNWTPAQSAASGIGGTTGGTSSFGAQLGVNTKDAQALITASYDFGVLKAFAGWSDRKVTSSVLGNNFAKRTAQEIGVRSFMTPKIEGWASIGNGRISAFGANQPTANIVGYQVGSNYWLSKRTNLYAIYGQNGTSSTSTGAFNASQYSLGARHTC